MTKAIQESASKVVIMPEVNHNGRALCPNCKVKMRGLFFHSGYGIEKCDNCKGTFAVPFEFTNEERTTGIFFHELIREVNVKGLEGKIALLSEEDQARMDNILYGVKF